MYFMVVVLMVWGGIAGVVFLCCAGDLVLDAIQAKIRPKLFEKSEFKILVFLHVLLP